jgi:hypothetical protein
VRTDVTLGVLYGLALLTKFHLLALLAPIGLAYLVAGRPACAPAPNWRTFVLQTVRGLLSVLGLAAVISGWWFWRNQVLYGDPIGMSKVNELWAGRSPVGNWWAVQQALPYLWSSLWGRFGYGQLPMPQIIYQVLYFCALALAGYLIPRRESPSLAHLALLGAVCLVFIVVVLYYVLIQPAGAMGRFLFPALPSFAVLFIGGLGRFFPRSARWRPSWTVSMVVTVGMAILAVYGLVGVLAPAFGRPRPLTDSEIEAAPNPIDVEFGGLARLLGYQVTPAVVEPGDTVEVTLYWQALAQTDQNYVVFVHLLSEEGPMVAQRDTHPGLGRYPTAAWKPGVAFADTYRVHVPEVAYTPDAGYVQVGLYLPGGPRLMTSDGRSALRLAPVEIRPRPGEFPNSMSVNFDGLIALVGYDLDRRMVQPGETIRLTLYWRALASMEDDLTVFAHARGDENQIWASHDSRPIDGTARTSRWQPDQVFEDVRDLPVGETTPPGFYDVEVGLFDSDGKRLPVVTEEGHQLNNRVLLSKIRVVSE